MHRQRTQRVDASIHLCKMVEVKVYNKDQCDLGALPPMNTHQPGFLIRQAPVLHPYFHPSALGSPPPPSPSSSIHQHSVSYLTPSHFFIHASIHHRKVPNLLLCTSSSIHPSSLCTHFFIHPFSIHPSSSIHPSRPLPSPTPQNLRQGSTGICKILPPPAQQLLSAFVLCNLATVAFAVWQRQNKIIGSGKVFLGQE